MRVTLFRDLPAEGWFSMERYADELHRALLGLGCQVSAYAPRQPRPRLPGRGRALLNYAWRLGVYPLLAPGRQGEVNHIIDHSYAHLLRRLDARRTVVTCHDLAPLSQAAPAGSFSQRAWRLAFEALPRAAHVIADSDFTRQAMLRATGLPPEHVSTVPLAVSAAFAAPPDARQVAALRREHGLDGGPLLLHVGSCEPRKNIETILSALPRLTPRGVRFAQVGGRFSPRQRELIETLELQNCVIQAAPAFGDSLLAWYAAADVFVFPSLLEGFGLPVLEAMAAGTPVVCAAAASLPEVAGEAAEMFDPRDTEALAAALERLLDDDARRAALIARGRARAAGFTWRRTAEDTLRVYEAVHAGSRR